MAAVDPPLELNVNRRVRRDSFPQAMVFALSPERCWWSSVETEGLHPWHRWQQGPRRGAGLPGACGHEQGGTSGAKGSKEGSPRGLGVLEGSWRTSGKGLWGLCESSGLDIVLWDGGWGWWGAERKVARRSPRTLLSEAAGEG